MAPMVSGVHTALMGFDVGEWTIRVLTDGMPPAPAVLERGQTIPIAVWKRGRFGAVLFVRRWRNDNIDSDCAITTMDPNGQWEYPWAWSGGGWFDEPLVRPADGWDGWALRWAGETSRDWEESDGTTVSVNAIQGTASARVAAIEVASADDTYLHPVTSPGGAFVIGVVNESATLSALGASGDIVVDGDGKPIVATVDSSGTRLS